MPYLGDYAEDAIADFGFNTRTLAQVPITLASGAVSVYKANGTTETTTGVTLTLDQDGRTGSHHVRIDMSDSFYAPGNDYKVEITAGTVDGISVAGTVLAEFSIENRFAEAVLPDGVIKRATFAADTGLQTIRSGTAQAGSASSITLDASASAVDNFYKYAWIRTTGGTGAGQTRLCVFYTGATKIALAVPNWATTPDNTTTFAILSAGQIFPGEGLDIASLDGDSGSLELLIAIVNAFVRGTVTDAGPAAGDFDGDSGLSADNDRYNNLWVTFTSGVLKGETRKVSDYTGASRNLQFTGSVGTPDAPWPEAPADGDRFIIIGHA